MSVAFKYKLSQRMVEALRGFEENPNESRQINARTHEGLRNRKIVSGCIIHVGRVNLTQTRLTDHGQKVLAELLLEEG